MSLKLHSDVTHVERGPIGTTLLSFALPVLLSQLLQELYNVTDCAVVGRFAGDYALSAVGEAGLVLSVLVKFFIGFSSGVSVVTSRLFGSRRYEELREAMASVFRLAIGAGLAMSALGVLGAESILRALRCPEPVLPAAAAYLRICSLGMAGQLVYNVGAEVLRSLGDTGTPMRLYGVSVVCNLALDAALVVGLRQGVAGAAAATLFSQLLLAGLVLRRLMRLGEGCALSLTGPGLERGELLDILRIGVPAGMQALFMSISSLLIQTQINGFGPDAVAGMTLYAKVEGILYLPTFAYGIALTGFVGQNLGAGQLGRIRSAVRLSLRMMTAVILPLSLAVTLSSPLILRLFTDDPGILFNAREAIVFNLPVYVVYAVDQVYLGAIKGLGNTSWPMVCTLLCYALFRVVWCWALIPVFGSMRVVYLSYDVSFFLMLALLLPEYARRMRASEAGGDPPLRTAIQHGRS